MSISTTQLSADLGYMIEDLPAVLTVAGITVRGAFTDVAMGDVLEEGGFVSEYAASFHAKLASFTTAPVAGITCSLASVTYRVERVSKASDGIAVRLDLITPDK